MKRHEAGSFVRVAAPAGFTNALLNGSEGIVTHHNPIGITTVLLISGEQASRDWQFCSEHLAVAATDG